MKTKNQKYQKGYTIITLAKSGGGFLPRQRFDKHQIAFLIIDIRPDFCNSLHRQYCTVTTRAHSFPR